MKRITLLAVVIAILAYAAGWLTAESERPIHISVVQVEDADAFDPDPTVHQL
jgi:hypothetical protein